MNPISDSGIKWLTLAIYWLKCTWSMISPCRSYKILWSCISGSDQGLLRYDHLLLLRHAGCGTALWWCILIGNTSLDMVSQKRINQVLALKTVCSPSQVGSKKTNRPRGTVVSRCFLSDIDGLPDVIEHEPSQLERTNHCTYQFTVSGNPLWSTVPPFCTVHFEGRILVDGINVRIIICKNWIIKSLYSPKTVLFGDTIRSNRFGSSQGEQRMKPWLLNY